MRLNSHEATALAAVSGSTVRTKILREEGVPARAYAAAAYSHRGQQYRCELGVNTTPVTNKAGLTTLVANETGLGPAVPKTQRESIVRALGEVGQTRTWNLLIDVIAQSGHV